MADDGPFIRFTLNFAGGTGTDETFTAYRSLTPNLPDFVVLQPFVPLLAERAVFVDVTAPIGPDLYYRFVGDTTGDVISSGPLNLPMNGHTWLKDPMRPWANIEMDTCSITLGHNSQCVTPDPEFVWGGLGALDHPDDAGVFDILNAEYAADVFARRKYANGSFVFFTRTLAGIDAVKDLFTAGGPLQLQLPDEYGWHDQFIQPQTLRMAYISNDQRRPERRWEVPFVVVEQPFGPVQGTDCANWCEVEAEFPTFDVMDSVGAAFTWLDLLQGEVLCPDTPIPLLSDTFTRTVASGWGAADTGQAWTVQLGPATDFSVNGSKGLHTHPVVNTFHETTAPWALANTNMRADFSLNVVPASDGADVHYVARYANSSNYYSARIFIASGGAMMLTLRKRVAGVESQLTTLATGLTYVANAIYSMRFSVIGSTLSAKIWLATTSEPAAYQTTIVDTDFAAAGSVGFRTFPRAALTNPLPIVYSFDNLVVT